MLSSEPLGRTPHLKLELQGHSSLTLLKCNVTSSVAQDGNCGWKPGKRPLKWKQKLNGLVARKV